MVVFWQQLLPLQFPNGSMQMVFCNWQESQFPEVVMLEHWHWGAPLARICPVSLQHDFPTHIWFGSSHIFLTVFHWQFAARHFGLFDWQVHKGYISLLSGPFKIWRVQQLGWGPLLLHTWVASEQEVGLDALYLHCGQKDCALHWHKGVPLLSSWAFT